MANQSHSLYLKLLNENTVVARDHVEELVTGERRARVTSWAKIVRIVDDARERIRSNKIPKSPRKQCYVGREFRNIQIWMFKLLPPRNDELVKVYQSFFESGVYRVWMEEYFGWSHSKRVQDRSRILDWKKRKWISEREFSQVDFNARLITIFNLWLICLGASVISAVLELIT